MRCYPGRRHPLKSRDCGAICLVGAAWPATADPPSSDGDVRMLLLWSVHFEVRKGTAMGIWSNLFGGGPPIEPGAEATGPRNAENGPVRSETVPSLFERALGRDPQHRTREARRRAAIGLVLANETAKGREAWLAIARDFPGELADALEQVGVCYHLEKDFGSALENYAAAIRVGANAAVLADNIAEARRSLAAVD